MRRLGASFTQQSQKRKGIEMADLLEAATNALADLEGIMPEHEPSGDRQHPAWVTIKELRQAINKTRENPE